MKQTTAPRYDRFIVVEPADDPPADQLIACYGYLWKKNPLWLSNLPGMSSTKAKSGRQVLQEARQLFAPQQHQAAA